MDDTSIYMFNALWFRPDGGRELYARYGREVAPLLAAAGGETMGTLFRSEAVVEGDFTPDVLGFVRYPSVEAFDRMWQSDAYRRIAHFRTDAVTRLALTRCRPMTAAERWPR